MSTYNGEKYLKEQIDSILNQTYKEINLLIRDDGSTDQTVSILQEYTEKYSNISYYAGKNIGVQKSFFDLMQKTNKDMDYYAFSDQDDVWLPDKIQRAVELLEQQDSKNQPLLYGGEVFYASENLQHIKKFAYKNLRPPTFGNALVENIFIGCTEVFNKELLKLVITHLPDCKILHDWWLYLTATCFGKAIYDKNAYILYRQHDKNQVGMQNNWIRRWKKRIGNFKNLKHSLRIQAQNFLLIYGKEYKEYDLVLLLAKYKNSRKKKWQLIFSKKVYRQQKIDDIMYRFLFFLVLL